MPALREQDFDKLAAQVVDEFLAKRAKLADAAAQVAMQHGLNPDQIERLTQSANTMTFLRMMEDAKAQGGQDLTQEFDPIDSRQVIRIVIDNTGVHVEADPSVDVNGGGAASAPDMQSMPGMEQELPDEMSALRDEGGGEMPESPKAPPFGKKDKADKADAKDDSDKPPKKDKKPESPKEAGLRIMRSRKLAGILEDQRLQAGLLFEETYDKLASRFQKLYSAPIFDAFEKDAMAEHGDEYGIQMLNAIRETRKLPPLEPQEVRSKVAALEDRHVSDDYEELRLFGTLVKIAREAKRLEQGLTTLRAQWT